MYHSIRIQFNKKYLIYEGKYYNKNQYPKLIKTTMIVKV